MAVTSSPHALPRQHIWDPKTKSAHLLRWHHGERVTMGQLSNSSPKDFSYLCEYAIRFDLSCSYCEYPAIFHCLHCSPSCFDPDSLLLAYLWLGLSWIDCISANKSFSSSKTSSRKPYTSSKQQEKHKHSVEITINFSWVQGQFQIYHPGLKVTWDGDSETVYDYHARVVKAIILELTRRLSEVRLLSFRSLSDRQMDLSEDIVPLRINLHASGRCRTLTEPYNKLLQDTKQAIATVVPSLHVYSIYSEEDNLNRNPNLEPVECAWGLAISDVHAKRCYAFPLPSGWKYYE